MLLTLTSILALLAWVTVLLLPSRPYLTRERLDLGSDAESELGEVCVLIPARNEAAQIERSLEALSVQGQALEVVVIDDESHDETVAIAAAVGQRLDERMTVRVLTGKPLPAGWGGKLWALQQGLEQAERPYCLLLDADIELAPGFLPSLLARLRCDELALASVMAKLRCSSFWERLLVPAFIFFFKLLYPFARVNDERTGTAAAAGGCVLVDRAVLDDLGGFHSIRDALIDDCTLAALVKGSGQRIWLGLSHQVLSHRAYPDFASFAQMVTRTAFTQLRYSLVLLLLVTAVMLVVFVAPVVAVLSFSPAATTITAALALAALMLAYYPTVRFYALPKLWLLTLPLAAVLFLAMTWSSAVNYWRGVRAKWKDRAYAAD